MRTHIQLVEEVDIAYPNRTKKDQASVQATVLLKQLKEPYLETRIRVALEAESLPAMTRDQLDGWILDALRQALATS